MLCSEKAAGALLQTWIAWRETLPQHHNMLLLCCKCLWRQVMAVVSKLVGKMKYYCRTTDVGMDCVKKIDCWCLQLCLYLLCLLDSLDTCPMWKLQIIYASHCWNVYLPFLVCQQLQVAMSWSSQEKRLPVSHLGTVSLLSVTDRKWAFQMII